MSERARQQLVGLAILAVVALVLALALVHEPARVPTDRAVQGSGLCEQGHFYGCER